MPISSAIPITSVARAPSGRGRAPPRAGPDPPSRCGGLSIGSRAVNRSRRVADRRALIRPHVGEAAVQQPWIRQLAAIAVRGRRPARGTSTARGHSRRAARSTCRPASRWPTRAGHRGAPGRTPAPPCRGRRRAARHTLANSLARCRANNPLSPGDTAAPTTRLTPASRAERRAPAARGRPGWPPTSTRRGCPGRSSRSAVLGSADRPWRAPRSARRRRRGTNW